MVTCAGCPYGTFGQRTGIQRSSAESVYVAHTDCTNQIGKQQRRRPEERRRGSYSPLTRPGLCGVVTGGTPGGLRATGVVGPQYSAQRATETRFQRALTARFTQPVTMITRLRLPRDHDLVRFDQVCEAAG